MRRSRPISMSRSTLSRPMHTGSSGSSASPGGGRRSGPPVSSISSERQAIHCSAHRSHPERRMDPIRGAVGRSRGWSGAVRRPSRRPDPADRKDATMPVTGKQPKRLSDADLQQLLGLLQGADSTELKLTVPDSEQRSTVAALGMDPLDAQVRQVYFFDTPDLALNRHGLVVRARRVQQRGNDSVVKLRPVIPDNLPSGLRKSKNLVVEVDAMPGGYVCSASLKGTPAADGVKAVAAGERPIHKLFSKEQQAFFATHAPEDV